MPTDLPASRGDDPTLDSLEAQAALLSDALVSADAFLVSDALHRIARAQGQSYGFGDDPALSIVLAALQALNLELVAKPATP